MFQEEAVAQSTWASKCEAVQPNENPTYQQMNCLLTNAAIDADIPPEVVKAVALQENNWKQFDEKGEPIISEDGGIGLMQITNKASYDQEKLKYDIYYNIEKGIEILNSMYDDRDDLPKIKGAGREVIENWYFPVMAYNGTNQLTVHCIAYWGRKIQKPIKNRFSVKLNGKFQNSKDSLQILLGQYPFETETLSDSTSSDKILILTRRNIR